ncbi:hypothetical protein PG985_010916 [Apiospora marii]|uniref:ABM domain-containing protein n=1 Tax=Apiospora marii TaxID=335849 RepID=A0ABR1T2B7_9PEZI
MASSTAAAADMPSSSSFSPDLSVNGCSLHVTVHIAPENWPQFKAAIQPVYEKVIREPECVFFEIYRSPDDPGTITWVENWTASPEWLATVQQPKEYYKEYLAITRPMFIKPQEVKVLHRLGREFLLIKDKQYASEF